MIKTDLSEAYFFVYVKYLCIYYISLKRDAHNAAVSKTVFLKGI